MRPNEDITQLPNLLAADSHDPIHACDLLLTVGVCSGRIDAMAVDHCTLKVVIGRNTSYQWEVKGLVGRFRGTLARLGYIFHEIQRGNTSPAGLSFAGRLTEQPRVTRLSSGWKIVRASASPSPGSPFYNLNGRMELRSRDDHEACLSVEMENTGRHQWLVLKSVTTFFSNPGME